MARKSTLAELQWPINFVTHVTVHIAQYVPVPLRCGSLIQTVRYLRYSQYRYLKLS